mgnify:CR=1 FL=1
MIGKDLFKDMCKEINVKIEKKNIDYIIVYRIFCNDEYFECDLLMFEEYEKELKRLLKNSNNIKFVLLNYKSEVLIYNNFKRIKDYYDYLIKNKDCKINLNCNF